MLLLYQLATQPHFTVVVEPKAVIVGGLRKKRKHERRGGLLHEQRLLDEIEAEERELDDRARVKARRRARTLPPLIVSASPSLGPLDDDEEELLILYLTGSI